MSHADSGPLASYNSLTDPNLAGYFTSVRLRRHLRRSGLVTKDGVVVSETVYRMNWAKREQKKKLHEILAQAILDKSLEVERMRQVEIRKKVEEISKVENVRRIKESRDHRKREDTLPLLSARHDSGSATAQSQQTKEEDEAAVTDERRRTQSAGPRPATSQYARQSRSARSPYRHIPPDLQGFVPSPPRQRQSTARSSARYRQIKSAKARSRSPTDETSTPRLQQPVANNCTVKMHYFGPNLKIDEDIDGRGDLITIEQQPAGCGTLIIFRDYVQRGSDFKFVSRRYRTHPFSLTIYVNSQQDCRLSTCCEYKHKPGARLGGQQGHFGIVRVTGDGPCFRCHFDEQERRKEKEKTDEKKQSSKKSKSEKGEKKAKKASRNKSAQDESRKTDAGLKIAVDSADGDGYDYEDDFENLNQDSQTSSKHSESKSSTPRSSSSKSSTRTSGSKSSDSQSSSSKSSSARSQDNVASSKNNDSATSAVANNTKSDKLDASSIASSSSRRSRKDDSHKSGKGNPDVKIMITEASNHSDDDDDNESNALDRSDSTARSNSGDADGKDSRNNDTLVKNDDDDDHSKKDDSVEERNDKPETVPSIRKSSVSSASSTGSKDRSASDSDGSGSNGRKKRRVKKKSNEKEATVDARHAEGAGVSDDNDDEQQKSDVEKDNDEKNADDQNSAGGETVSLFDTSYESDKSDKGSKEVKTDAGGADQRANDENADGEVQLKVFTDNDQLTDQDNQIKEETFRVFASTPVGDNGKKVETSEAPNVDKEKVDDSIKPAETEASSSNNNNSNNNNARRYSSDSSSGSSFSESDSESGSESSSDTGSNSSSSSSDEDSKAGDRNNGRNAQLM